VLPVLLLLLLFPFRKLGDEWSADQDVTDELEAFTCLMYGHAQEKSVNSVRSIMLQKMVGEKQELTTKSKVDFSRFPPFRDSLIPHIGRVNYSLANYKRAHKAIFLHPNRSLRSWAGWKKTEEGVLEPVWSCGPVLPPSLIDLLEQTAEEAEKVAKEEEEQEIDYEELHSDDE